MEGNEDGGGRGASDTNVEFRLSSVPNSPDGCSSVPSILLILQSELSFHEVPGFHLGAPAAEGKGVKLISSPILLLANGFSFEREGTIFRIPSCFLLYPE